MNYKPIKLVLSLLIVVLIGLRYSAAMGKLPVSSTNKIQLNTLNGVYKFTGKLNNKIPVFLWFVVQDGFVKGEVTYLKTTRKIPITIAGTIFKADDPRGNANKTSYFDIRIFEFMKDGTITGVYYGPFHTSVLNGTWLAPGSRKELKFSLKAKDTTLTNMDINLNPVSITGEYVYSFGKDGAGGSMVIKSLGRNNYLMEVGCVTDGPAYNLANVDATKIHLTHDSTIFQPADPGCRFKIRFFKNFLVIDFLGPSINPCGFGNNASIDGVFIKTSENARIEKVEH
jgi:hypothetical protein